MFPFSMLTFNLLSWISSKLRGIQEQHDLRFETARLSTFRNWPLSCSIDPARLAAAGFFYTGISTTVKCFVCKVEISQWTKYSIPVLIHKMYCPECPLVRHEHRGNVPIKSRSYLRPRRVSKLANLKYLTYESRLNTFVAWPNTYIRSEKLADAGFYYNGINDMVICHHCGIAIDNWSRGEDPCNRHATSSPGCCYIIKGRSCECINNVTGQDLHETFVEAPIETTDENHEGSDSVNETNEMTLVEKIAALEKENQELENARSCKVCTEREATITFLPCGHLATCRYCSATFMKCIICQGKIKAAVRIAFA